MVFSIILAVVIVVLIFNFLRLSKKNTTNPAEIFNNLKSDLLSSIRKSKELRTKDKNLFNFARQFFYSLSIIFLALMAVSGFLLPLFWQTMDGILLFIHLFVAPFFVVSVVVAIALFAYRMQFNAADYAYLSAQRTARKQKSIFWKKIYFWLFIIAIIFNLGSMLLAMYPLLGTSGQNWLLNMHRYSALVLLILTVNYLTLKYTLKSNR